MKEEKNRIPGTMFFGNPIPGPRRMAGDKMLIHDTYIRNRKMKKVKTSAVVKIIVAVILFTVAIRMFIALILSI